MLIMDMLLDSNWLLERIIMVHVFHIFSTRKEDGCSEAGSELLLISRYLLQTGSYCWILVRYLVKGKRQWESGVS